MPRGPAVPVDTDDEIPGLEDSDEFLADMKRRLAAKAVAT